MVTTWTNIVGAGNSSNLVTNPNFTGSATGWTLGTGWSYSSNSVNYAGTTTGTIYTIPNNLTNSGSGYTAGDILTIAGGDNQAKIGVDQVDGTGVIIGLSLITNGNGYPIGLYSLTGGTGTGATITISTQEIVGQPLQQTLSSLTRANGFAQAIATLTGATGGVIVTLGSTDLMNYASFFPSPGENQSGVFSYTPSQPVLYFWPTGDFTGTVDNVSLVSFASSQWTDISAPSPLSWTDLAKPSGTSYTDIAKPTDGHQTIFKGTPIGLLLALTYATDVVSGSNWHNIATNSSLWTDIPKAT